MDFTLGLGSPNSDPGAAVSPEGMHLNDIIAINLAGNNSRSRQLETVNEERSWYRLEKTPTKTREVTS